MSRADNNGAQSGGGKGKVVVDRPTQPPQPVQAGGKPSKGTPRDKRLKENK